MADHLPDESYDGDGSVPIERAEYLYQPLPTPSRERLPSPDAFDRPDYYRRLFACHCRGYDDCDGPFICRAFELPRNALYRRRRIFDVAAIGDSSIGLSTNPRLRARREINARSSTDDEFETAMTQLKKTAYKPCSSSPQKQTALRRVISGIFRAGTPRTKAAAPNGEEEEEKACTICLEEFRPGEQVVVTPCNHMFHQGCVAPWVKGHFSCPVCRSALRKSGGINVADDGNSGGEDASAGWSGLESMMMAMGME